MFATYFFSILFLLFLDVLLASVTMYIAYSHGHSRLKWFVLGLVLPFVSIFIALAVAIRDEQRAKAARGGAPAPRPEPGEFS
ncbi:hypothetical protein E4631_11855 [Hymenobacter sp. UV11]|uniref:hypothetical protein n=1 Tax=Hymenobacter sp. UV11 TaxID=1849735 RepID=UPI0010619F9F|nr:hypothetical protein [Hymenobacter sp. UV11]TDN40305.1 hypothetical protein A8B98_12715 [Hymenobacter sp. UV11]TFZ66697.1 hypothetical protein E4631_11855 [Hymenobacter sp. UV11]